MEDKRNDAVPYIVHEGEMARMERVNNRLWVVVIILIAVVVITNGLWIWYESQWEVVHETTQEVTQDTGNGNGTNNFVGGDYYGEADSKDNNP